LYWYWWRVGNEASCLPCIHSRAAVQATLKHQQEQSQTLHQKGSSGTNKKVEKHVRMSNEIKNERVVRSQERPQTARSVMSNFSYKSEFSEDGRDSTFTTDYDRLPAELRPSVDVMHFRRESQMPKLKKKTRLEKMQSQVKEKERSQAREKERRQAKEKESQAEEKDGKIKKAIRK
jgi:hypothetical protein